MTLEEKLAKSEIRNILVVDDTQANLDAAKQYFARLEPLGIKAEYAASAQEAQQKIQESFESKDKYGLVITDLCMESPKAGLEVVREGFEHLIYTVIATGMNYDAPGVEPDHHGPFTRIMPLNETLRGRKDDPEIWRQVLEKTMDYIAGGSHTAIYRSIQKVGTLGVRIKGVADSMMPMFRG
ncbi:response regulator [Candidatus Woesearchaeota archaeon]|nr:response regulator [Candidatus Woesearchaeota archaeon]